MASSRCLGDLRNKKLRNHKLAVQLFLIIYHWIYKRLILPFLAGKKMLFFSVLPWNTNILRVIECMSLRSLLLNDYTIIHVQLVSTPFLMFVSHKFPWYLDAHNIEILAQYTYPVSHTIELHICKALTELWIWILVVHAWQYTWHYFFSVLFPNLLNHCDFIITPYPGSFIRPYHDNGCLQNSIRIKLSPMSLG